MAQQKSSSSFFGVRELKVVLIGDAGVGKTSILNRYITGSHSQNISPTLGAAFTTKIVESEGENVKLQIWDTSGEEKYRSMAPLYYRGASAIILAFDLTTEDTFNNLASWISQLKGNINLEHAQIVLVGNKLDLATGEMRQVDEQKAKDYAASLKAAYYEASAVSGENVEDIFVKVASFRPHTNQNNGKVSKELEPEESVDENKKSCC